MIATCSSPHPWCAYMCSARGGLYTARAWRQGNARDRAGGCTITLGEASPVDGAARVKRGAALDAARGVGKRAPRQRGGSLPGGSFFSSIAVSRRVQFADTIKARRGGSVGSRGGSTQTFQVALKLDPGERSSCLVPARRSLHAKKSTRHGLLNSTDACRPFVEGHRRAMRGLSWRSAFGRGSSADDPCEVRAPRRGRGR